MRGSVLSKPRDKITQFLDLYDVESGILVPPILDRAEGGSAISRWSNGYKIRGTSNFGFSEVGLEGGSGSICWIDGWLFQEHTQQDMLKCNFVTVSEDYDTIQV